MPDPRATTGAGRGAATGTAPADPFAPVLGARRGRPDDNADDGSDGAAGPSLLARLDALGARLAEMVEVRPNRLTDMELLHRSAQMLARDVSLEVGEPVLRGGIVGGALLPVVSVGGTTLALVELTLDASDVGRSFAYVCRDLVMAAREGA